VNELDGVSTLPCLFDLPKSSFQKRIFGGPGEPGGAENRRRDLSQERAGGEGDRGEEGGVSNSRFEAQPIRMDSRTIEGAHSKNHVRSQATKNTVSKPEKIRQGV
jgi:hypothetical protein